MTEDFETILLHILEEKKVENWRTLAIKEIGFEIFKKNFDFIKAGYNKFFEKLTEDSQKMRKFDEVIRFYYFWCKRPSVDKILRPDFKLIVMFSAIESLMSDVKYLSLGDWLKEEMNKNPFSIKDKSSLNTILERYYSVYGSNKKIIQFFEKYYSPKSLEELKKSIKTWNEGAKKFEILSDIKDVVSFVIGSRHLFIHRATGIHISSREQYEKDAEGYTSFSSHLLTVIKGKSYEIDRAKVHIDELLSGFEEGLLNFFKS